MEAPWKHADSAWPHLEPPWKQLDVPWQHLELFWSMDSWRLIWNRLPCAPWTWKFSGRASPLTLWTLFLSNGRPRLLISDGVTRRLVCRDNWGKHYTALQRKHSVLVLGSSLVLVKLFNSLEGFWWGDLVYGWTLSESFALVHLGYCSTRVGHRFPKRRRECSGFRKKLLGFFALFNKSDHTK